MPNLVISKNKDREKPPLLVLAENTREEVDYALSTFNNPLFQGPILTQCLEKQTAESKIDQGTEDMDELRAIASRVREAHNALTAEIAEASSGHPVLAKKLKSEERMWDKYVENGFDHNGIGDVVRTSIHFDNLETLYQAVMELYERVQIVRVKDRFLRPKASGYRDLLFNVRMVDPVTGKDHMTEIQFQLEDMHWAKKAEYPSYFKRRALELELASIQKTHPDETIKIRDLKAEIARLESNSRRIFERAWQPFMGQLSGYEVAA
jgi:hypothetical protein